MKKILIIGIMVYSMHHAYGFDYVLHKNYVPRASLAQPQKGVEVTDPDFHTTFKRISDATNDGGNNRLAIVVYSRWTPLSSGRDYLYLQRTVGNPDMLLYSAKDYSLIKIMPSQISIDGSSKQTFISMESADIRWDYTGNFPNRFYYVNGAKFYEYDVRTDSAHLLHDFSNEFPTANVVHNDVEGDSSADSRYWVFMVKGPYDGSRFPMLAIITYDKETDTILDTLDYAKYQALGGKMSYLPAPNMVDMAPSGDRIVLLNMRCYSYMVGGEEQGIRPLDVGGYFDGGWAFDLDFTHPIKVAIDAVHTGWGWDYAGNEMFISQNNRVDWIEACNIQTGEVLQMIFHGDLGWNTGMHFSRMPEINRGWVLMSTYKTTSTNWGDNQLIMLEIKDKADNPRVWRLGHMHNNYDEYYAEGFAAMSQYGDKLWWEAKWPGQNDIETYEMTLPNKWWVELAGGDATPPYTFGHLPADGDIDVDKYTSIVLHVADNGFGVDRTSITVTVDGATVYDGSNQSGYPHTMVTGVDNDYTITYTPSVPFDHDQIVSVVVDAADLASPSNTMNADTYSFTISSGPPAATNDTVTQDAWIDEIHNDFIIIGSTDGKGTINPDKGDTAKIYFSGSNTGKYECRIFTLTGELIWENTKNNVQQGMFEWPARNTASGTYVVHVKGPGLGKRRKVIVIK